MTDHAHRIAFLDYLRIFAFTTVIAGHTYHDSWAALASLPDTPWLLHTLLAGVLPLVYAGGSGVIVFFMVSGYVILHVLQSENTLDFLVKRFFRIYPLYVTAVISQYLLENPAGLLLGLPLVLAQLSLLGDFTGTAWSLGGVEWTLRLELLFYLFMAALHCLRISSIRCRALPIALAGLTVSLPYLPVFPSWSVWTVGYLNLYAPFFFLGMGFYLLEKHSLPAPVLTVFTLLVVGQFTFWIGEWHPRWRGVSFAAIAVAVFALSWLLRNHLLPRRWILGLSQLTYASYLLHAWLHRHLHHALELLFNVPTWLMEFMSLGLLLICCALAVRWVEQPAIRYGQRWLAAHNSRTTPAT